MNPVSAMREGSQEPVGSGNALSVRPQVGAEVSSNRIPPMQLRRRPLSDAASLRCCASPSWPLAWLLLCILLSCFPEVGRACSTPVFRYALERWRPSAYPATVFHKGPLSSNDLAAVELLRQTESLGRANLTVEVVDLQSETNQEPLRLWQTFPGVQPPWLIVRYPESKPPTPPAWSGALTLENIRGVLESPVRSETVRRIGAGATAVWLLLESTNAAQNDAAFQRLQSLVKTHERTLEIAVDPDEPTNTIQFPVTYALLRVSNNAPAESAFRAMLVNFDEEKAQGADAIVVPVYGRGRGLVALPAEKVTADVVGEICAFVTGACSCEVKEQNPGMDLLMTADWDAAAEGKRLSDPPPAGLVGIPHLAETNPPGVPSISDPTALPHSLESASNPLVRNLIRSALGVVALVALASAVLWRRGKRGG